MATHLSKNIPPSLLLCSAGVDGWECDGSVIVVCLWCDSGAMWHDSSVIVV